MNLRIFRNNQFVSEIKNGNQIFIETQTIAEYNKIEEEFPKHFYEELNQIKKEILN